MHQNSCIPGVSCCIFVLQAEDDFKNKKETLKPKIKQIAQQLKRPFMFIKQTNCHTIWPRQKAHGFPIASHSVLVRFSLTSR